MKLQRYELAGTYDDDVRPRDDGRWCESTDVQKLELELERLIEENKWLRKEKEGMIQYERDKRNHLYKMADEFGFWDEFQKLDKSKGKK